MILVTGAAGFIGLGMGGILILYYEFTYKWEQMVSIIIVYILLGIGAWFYSKKGSISN